ncbi:hypothetical protein R1sor_010031 [Riccia sorocarpa]|uniref:Reverse transcriptase domain-containing protein n=1 Tax=Riccia sorocarpa TaxID=122646 RepID=A0ABD3HWU1_9MARC
MVHDGTSSLADHIPIRVNITLQDGAGDGHMKSYFKMDGRMLQKQEVLSEVRREWTAHPSWAVDDRRRWGLALARTSAVLMRNKNNDRADMIEAGRIHKKLAEARLAVQENNCDETIRVFEEALQASRRRERLDIRLTRVRCRIKWLNDGEAPSRFFFAYMKAKNARENITSVKIETGEVVTDEDRILQLIEDTYNELYTAEPENVQTSEKRREVLQKIDRRLTLEQNITLGEVPSEEYIEEIVRELPKDKSPGFDGVTAEVLVAGWDFMGPDCFNMVRKVWRSSMLLSKDNRGIIKLIPKADALFLLKNWRPITLLTTTYKILAKILARRLKNMLPDIIDQQQTRFITGRNIVENIFSLRMAQEWAPTTAQEILFVKLDFQKAYDRVSHSYLWETLTALGVSRDNLQRIQGLVIGGAAQVHVNGQFTKRFAVTRGVRQGCPLAPLLFAMVTQPLMRMLREEEQQERLHGVNYGGERSLLHQIYADDTGVNVTMEEIQFDRLKAVIQDFEVISGARLNLSKSLIMPISSPPLPEWIDQTGCEVARAGMSFVYLGVCTSHPIDEAQITKAIVDKVMKKLSHWSHRLLSWPSRVLLLRHVLNATPLYQLLSVGLETKGLEVLEALGRQFLWGWRDQESPKASLVGWERITQNKEDGGLGWHPLADKAGAFQLRNVVKIMKGDKVEWAAMAGSFILRTLRNGRYQRERRQWRISEALLLLPFSKVNGSRTLTRMLAVWNKMRKKIKWEDSEREIPGHLTLGQGVQLMRWGQTEEIKELQVIVDILRRGNIGTTRQGVQCWEEGTSWLDELQKAGIYLEETEKLKAVEAARESAAMEEEDDTELDNSTNLGPTSQHSLQGEESVENRVTV